MSVAAASSSVALSTTRRLLPLGLAGDTSLATHLDRYGPLRRLDLGFRSDRGTPNRPMAIPFGAGLL